MYTNIEIYIFFTKLLTRNFLHVHVYLNDIATKPFDSFKIF